MDSTAYTYTTHRIKLAVHFDYSKYRVVVLHPFAVARSTKIFAGLEQKNGYDFL
jgi:hypothetical protein